jgi:hypothetical protein
VVSTKVTNLTRLESNYCSCAGRSSENICSSSAGAKGKKDIQHETQFITKIDGFIMSFINPSFLNANVLVCTFFSESHFMCDQTQTQTQGFGVVFALLYKQLLGPL